MSEGDFRIKVTGSAGDGIISASEILFTFLAHLNYHVSLYKDIPSSIRSGQTSSIITFSSTPIISPVGKCTILFLLNNSLDSTTLTEINAASFAFVSEKLRDQIDLLKTGRTTVCFLPTALLTISKAVTLLGIITNSLGFPAPEMQRIISGKFPEEKSRNDNRNSFTSGFSWAQQEKISFTSHPNPCSSEVNLDIMDGNRAISHAAIAAGCRFFSSYPITPATTIGETLANLLPQYDGVAYQAEDEIAALATVAGASFSGVKSMTATSGPGFSLMQEMIGYLSMVELPAVIVNVMRAGPSTGIPTHHGQDDLLAAAFGGHGEAPRIIIAPASIEDCYTTTIDAFNCAEYYACPVIILSDYSLAFTKKTISRSALNYKKVLKRKNDLQSVSDPDFQRYSPDNSIYPELPAPGFSNCTYRITGLEHDSHSFPSEDMKIHEQQMVQRFAKLTNIEREYNHLIEWDLEKDEIHKADACIVSWGFSVMPVKEAIISLRKKEIKIAALFPKLLFPVCVNTFNKLLLYNSSIIVVESNFSGQFASLIRMYTDANVISVNTFNGQPISSDYIESQIENIIAKNRNNENA